MWTVRAARGPKILRGHTDSNTGEINLYAYTVPLVHARFTLACGKTADTKLVFAEMWIFFAVKGGPVVRAPEYGPWVLYTKSSTQSMRIQLVRALHARVKTDYMIRDVPLLLPV